MESEHTRVHQVVPESTEPSEIVEFLRIKQWLMRHKTSAFLVPDLDIFLQINKRLWFNKNLQEVIGHVLVTQTNLVDIIEILLFHQFFNKIVAPGVCDLVVDELLDEQFA